VEEHDAPVAGDGGTAKDGVAALRLDQITVQFGGVRALDEVSMEVPRGQVRGIMGANGAGKTTLFDVISGVTQPRAGKVELDGRDVTKLTPASRARLGLRRTFQRTQVFGRLSVRDNLLMAMEWRGGGGGLLADVVGIVPGRRRLEAQRRARVDEVVERCGLGDVAHLPAGVLPVALARIVEFGRAIVDHPSVLLLDEPSSGLDDAEAHRMGALVRDLVETDACAVLLVEHDVAFVMEHSDRITVLDLGGVIAEGTAAEVRADDMVKAAYLG